MAFTEHAWTGAGDVLEAIQRHPFIAALADGTLSGERFGYYMTQDALYLADYARMLALAASQADDADEVQFWSSSAANVVTVERELHARSVTGLSAAEKSPTCTAYTAFLAELGSLGSYPALVTGLVPCFWIYEYVGAWILDTAGDLARHPYAAWIKTYSDPAFAASSRRAREIMDRAVAVSPGAAPRAHQAFLTCSRYEWMFWDAAWRMEVWPV
jgi:thiaminase